MRYLLILLAPLWLSHTSHESPESTSARIYIQNTSPDCAAILEYKACLDESCNKTSQSTSSCGSGSSNVITVSDWEEGVSYFCWIKASLGAGFSSEVYLNSRCGSTYTLPVVDCHANVKQVQATGSGTEMNVLIF